MEAINLSPIGVTLVLGALTALYAWFCVWGSREHGHWGSDMGVLAWLAYAVSGVVGAVMWSSWLVWVTHTPIGG